MFLFHLLTVSILYPQPRDLLSQVVQDQLFVCVSDTETSLKCNGYHFSVNTMHDNSYRIMRISEPYRHFTTFITIFNKGKSILK